MGGSDSARVFQFYDRVVDGISQQEVGSGMSEYIGWIRVEGKVALANVEEAKWECEEDDELQDELNTLFPIVYQQHQGLPGEGAVRDAAEHFETEPHFDRPEFYEDSDDLDTDSDN